MLTVRFTQQQYSVNESEESVMIGLQLSRPAGVDVTIGVLPVAGTAQGLLFKIFVSKDCPRKGGKNTSFTKILRPIQI